MKNFPCCILLAPFAAIGLLALLSESGIINSSLPIAAWLIGSFCAAGILALFLADYAPERATPASSAAQMLKGATTRCRPIANRASRPSHSQHPLGQSTANSTVQDALTTLGLRQPSVTAH